MGARPRLRRLEHAGDGRAAVRLRRPRQPGLAAGDDHDGHLRERAHPDREGAGRRRPRVRDQAVHRRRHPRQARAARPAPAGGPPVTQYAEEWLFAKVDDEDTGERRRRTDVRPVIAELIDDATVQSIAEEAWVALVGEDEPLVPLPAELPVDRLSSWV